MIFVSILKPSTNKIMNTLQLIVMLINTIRFELPQFNHDGPKKYFTQADNQIDTWMLILQTINTVLVWTTTDSEVASIWLTWFVLVFVVVKTMYCARGYDSIQSLVYLVKGSLFGIKDFMALFVYSVFIFAMFTQLTKIDKPGYDDIHDDDEFPDILFLRHILNSFSNSVGDLNYPGYETNWNTDDGYMSPAMIALIFIHYYMQIIFMVIVLLNLLISVVSENYDNITDKKDEIQL